MVDREEFEEDSTHFSDRDIVCPYCDYRLKNNYDYDNLDKFMYEDDEDRIYQCEKCDKEFMAICNVHVTYDTFKKLEE